MYHRLVEDFARSIEHLEFELQRMLKRNWKAEQKATSELDLAVSELRIWVAVLAAGACRGVKGLTTFGNQIMDDLLRKYDEARSWQ
jgi:hypothetical protein